MKKLHLSITLALVYFVSFQTIRAQEIPIVFDGHLYVDSLINRRDSGHFILDTGADGLYLDFLFYSRMGCQFAKVAKGKLPGVGGGAQEVTIILDSASF